VYCPGVFHTSGYVRIGEFQILYYVCQLEDESQNETFRHLHAYKADDELDPCDVIDQYQWEYDNQYVVHGLEEEEFEQFDRRTFAGVVLADAVLEEFDIVFYENPRQAGQSVEHEGIVVLVALYGFWFVLRANAYQSRGNDKIFVVVVDVGEHVVHQVVGDFPVIGVCADEVEYGAEGVVYKFVAGV